MRRDAAYRRISTCLRWYTRMDLVHKVDITLAAGLQDCPSACQAGGVRASPAVSETAHLRGLLLIIEAPDFALAGVALAKIRL